MRELKSTCPYCGDNTHMELVVNLPTKFEIEEDGKVNFSVCNAPMINKIDDLFNKFNKYKVNGHCTTCNRNSSCILTKDKRVIFVKNGDIKK